MFILHVNDTRTIEHRYATATIVRDMGIRMSKTADQIFPKHIRLIINFSENWKHRLGVNIEISSTDRMIGSLRSTFQNVRFPQLPSNIRKTSRMSMKVYKMVILPTGFASRWLNVFAAIHRQQRIRRPLELPIHIHDTTAVTKKIFDHDVATEECIRSLIWSHPVVVFAKPWCPHCRRALEALALGGMVDPKVIDLSALGGEDYRRVQDVLEGVTGRRTVPNVFVGGISIGGGDETTYLQSQGSLQALVGTAMRKFQLTERQQR